MVRRQRELPDWPQFQGRRVIATHRGRSAIASALKIAGLSNSDEVLVPSYNCGSEIDPVFHCGAVPVMYRVDRKGNIDLEDLKQRRTSRTKIVYITHYFGWPQQTEELQRWCRESQLFLIEDCALSLFSSSPAKPLGMVGDAAIFSLGKSLAVPDGGVLSISKQRDAVNRIARPPHAKRILRGSLSLLKKAAVQQCHRRIWSISGRRIACRANERSTSSIPGRPDMPSHYYFDPDQSGRRMSRITQGLIHGVDPRAIVRQRRSNYQRLHELLNGGKGFEPLFGELPEGICPLIYPLLVNQRSEAAKQLLAFGIDIIEWWSGYHRSLPWDEFKDACFLKDHLLALPIHQQLNESDVEYIAQCVQKVMRSN